MFSRNLTITTKKQNGDFGESVAVKFLKLLDAKIIATNWHCHWGELDIVAEIKDYVVFVEVKTRTRRDYQSITEILPRRKLVKLERTINNFLLIHDLKDRNWRLDFICIFKEKLHKQGAFENAQAIYLNEAIAVGQTVFEVWYYPWVLL